MAFTGTLVKKSVFGDVRVAIVSCTADALSGSVTVGGINNVLAVTLGPSSMNTAGVQIYPNQNAAGTTTKGSVKISGCTSGDGFFLVVYGT